tara:strand:+ start:10810 stop:11025 length:216 start_codon:yes stop_codon:yes gene_type:complete
MEFKSFFNLVFTTCFFTWLLFEIYPLESKSMLKSDEYSEAQNFICFGFEFMGRAILLWIAIRLIYLHDDCF